MKTLPSARTIAPRQLLFFLGCIAPLAKLVLLPAQLAADAKNDLLLSALLPVALESLSVFAAVLLSKRALSFFALLERSFGRVFDLLGPLSVLSFAVLVLFSMGEADFAALLPAGISGAKGIFTGAKHALAWFFDGALVLPLLDKIQYKKGLAWKAAAVHLAGGGAVLLFLALFYGIFQDIAPVQFFAFAKTAKYFPAVGILGRVDYLFIYALALAMIFASLMPMFSAAELLKEAFGESKQKCLLYSLLLNGAMIASSAALGFAFPAAERFLTRTLVWLFPLFSAALPLALLLLKGRRRERREA